MATAQSISFLRADLPWLCCILSRDEHSKAVGDKVAALFEAARKDAEVAYAEAQKDAKPKKGQAKPTAEEAEAAKEAAIAALIKPVPQGELARLRSDNSARAGR